MSQGKIFLQQWGGKDNLYIVDRLVDRITPKVGSVLTEDEVAGFVRDRHVTVTIKRGGE